MERGRTRVIRRKGFSFMSFLLGILFGMILLVGAIGGAVAFVLFTDLDTIFETVGLENKDEDGNYIYINTDPENGGAKTGFDLVQVMSGYVFDLENQSIGELEHVVPAIAELVNGVMDSFSEYIEVDLAKLRATKFVDIGDFISDTVMDLKPAKLISDFGVETEGDGVASTLMSALVYGAQADYVVVDGYKYPVRYDEAEADSTVRTARDAQPDEEGKTTYKIYFFEKEANEYYLCLRNSDGSYEATTDRYTPKAPKLTGYYYYLNGDSSNDRIIETSVTLRVLTSDDGMQGILDGILITDLINQSEGIIGEILGGLSVGQITSGEVDINEKVQNIQVASIIDIDPNSTIMCYLGYDISAVTAADEGLAYQYTASKGGDIVYVCADGDKITGVYADAELTRKLEATKVSQIGSQIDNARTDAFMDISPDNKLMMFIAYGVSDVVASAGEGYDFTGIYRYTEENADGEEEDYETVCYILSDGNKISRIFYNEGGEEKVIEACKISQVGNRVNNFTIDVLLDIEIDNAILMYMCYGVTGIAPAPSGEDYAYVGYYHSNGNTVKCYIDADENHINSVYFYRDGEIRLVPATRVNNISARVKGITDDLSIAEFMDIKPDNSIMMYIAYGVSGLDGLTGTYKDDEGGSHSVTIELDDDGNTKYVYYEKSGEREYLSGTSISGIAGKVGSFKDDLTVGEVLGVNDDSSKILKALKDSTISGMDGAVQDLELNVFLGDNEDTSKSSVLNALKNTKVKDISTKINSLTLQELYPQNIYSGDIALATEYNAGYVYYTKNGDVYEFANPAAGENRGKLTETEFASGTYYTYGELTGVWKFLLSKRVGEGENRYYNESVCELNNIGSLIDGAAQNINNASLGELQRAGILDPNADLSGTLVWTENGTPKSAELRKMSLAELISAVSYMSTNISQIG